MLSVAIALEPPAESAAMRVVTKSCEDAIGEGRCPAAEALHPGDVVSYYARLRVEEPDARELTIEFHDRGPDGVLIERRVLAFPEAANATSRWDSAGAVIAAFVAARDGAQRPPRPASLPPRPTALPPRESLAYSLDLAVIAGPGLDRGSYRLGVLGRGQVALPGAPGALGLLSVRYAERPGDLRLSWWSLSGGLGARLGGPPSALSAEVSGELAFERLQMLASAPFTSATNAAAQNRWGGRLGMNFALQLVNRLAWVAGAEATALRPTISITVDEENRGRAPAVTYAFSTGLRFSGGGGGGGGAGGGGAGGGGGGAGGGAAGGGGAGDGR